MRTLSPTVPSFAALALFVVAFAAPASASPPSIFVDGREVTTDIPAIGEGGRMYVPLRVVEKLGAHVTFDENAGVADILWRGVEAKVYSGSQVAWVDGARMAMDYAPREFASRMEVPLHFLTQAFHVDTDYDAGTNTIAIVTGLPRGNFVATLTGTTSGAASVYAGPSNGASSYGPTLPGTPPSVDDLRPAPDSVVGSTFPQIYARLTGNSSSVNPATVHLIVDGGDVTSLATISSAYVSYTPSASLGNGTHTVEVTGESDDEASLDQSWSFRVDSGRNYDYASGIIGYDAPLYGYGRYGFCPPGFSLFSPGPAYLVAGNIVEVIFFSRFFPFGSGFFTIGGIPGQFALQPWYGYPGYYWGMMTVPFGAHARAGVLAARFKTSDGRTVVVHSTTPLRIDGFRRTLPAGVRYAMIPSIVNRPKSPRGVVVFRPVPIAYRTNTGHPIGYAGRMPITTLPSASRPAIVPARPAAPVIAVPPAMPIRQPVVARPIVPPPAPPMIWPQIPARPIPPPVPIPKATPHA
ncbi:MAG TPA: copper amine oxidase N-terminal domain-containing protein [Candidatus Eremiobacteraceae bacterium]|nr:copper amine oxidase N-terminal domain-containing protein [Candidatus Eremiobacteraceae bacterium]